MTYMIDARLEHGMPSLILVDAVTGEERLHWHGYNMANGNNDWKGLFKRLILLSCVDQLSLVQRAKSPVFGDECIKCSTCVEQQASKIPPSGQWEHHNLVMPPLCDE
ncbi:MAG: hypothetical protein L3J89_02655 [Gammaproteobacteria bacterium]|nr:hypothetical protein [Gammaproteobacteria bacterium]